MTKTRSDSSVSFREEVQAGTANRLRTARVVLAHRAAEEKVPSDLDDILSTVVDEPRYIVTNLSGLPMSQPILLVNTQQAAREFYEAMHESFQPLHAVRLHLISTEWYCFMEQFTTRLDVPTGKELRVHGCVLFPVTESAIIGEVPWSRQQDSHVAANIVSADAALPTSLSVVSAVELFDDAFWHGAGEGLADLVARDFRLAERNFLDPDIPVNAVVGGTAAEEYVQGLRRVLTPIETTLVTRAATEWYCFEEFSVRARLEQPVGGHQAGTLVDYHDAAIYPASDGKVLARP